MKKSQKFLIESGVLLATMSIRAKKTGSNIKEYFYEEETIKHISLVLYDLLPLSVKIGMRYQKFHEIFERNFKAIRNALLGKENIEDSKNIEKTETLKINEDKTNIVEHESNIIEDKKIEKKTRKAPIKKPAQARNSKEKITKQK